MPAVASKSRSSATSRRARASLARLSPHDSRRAAFIRKVNKAYTKQVCAETLALVDELDAAEAAS